MTVPLFSNNDSKIVHTIQEKVCASKDQTPWLTHALQSYVTVHLNFTQTICNPFPELCPLMGKILLKDLVSK